MCPAVSSTYCWDCVGFRRHNVRVSAVCLLVLLFIVTIEITCLDCCFQIQSKLGSSLILGAGFHDLYEEYCETGAECYSIIYCVIVVVVIQSIPLPAAGGRRRGFNQPLDLNWIVAVVKNGRQEEREKDQCGFGQIFRCSHCLLYTSPSPRDS